MESRREAEKSVGGDVEILDHVTVERELEAGRYRLRGLKVVNRDSSDTKLYSS